MPKYFVSIFSYINCIRQKTFLENFGSEKGSKFNPQLLIEKCHFLGELVEFRVQKGYLLFVPQLYS